MPFAVSLREIIRGSFISSFCGRVLQAARRQINTINIVTNDDLIVFIYIKSEKMQKNEKKVIFFAFFL